MQRYACACFSNPFCKHLLWAIDRGIRCFRKAKVHPRYTMGSSLMEAYSNLISTWAFTRPLRCHGTCPWVRRLMPVDLWVHRIVSPEFVFANHQPSPRVASLRVQKPNVKRFYTPRMRHKDHKVTITALNSIDKSLHSLFQLKGTAPLWTVCNWL